MRKLAHAEAPPAIREARAQFIAAVRLRLVERGVSASHLARRIGITPNTIQYGWLPGKTFPTPRLLRALCVHLGLPTPAGVYPVPGASPSSESPSASPDPL